MPRVIADPTSTEGRSRDTSLHVRKPDAFVPTWPLKLPPFCNIWRMRTSTGSREGSSSLPNPIYRGFGTPLGARPNPHEMTIHNGFKPTQSLLPAEWPTRGEHMAGPRHPIAAIIQPPRRVATKLRTLQKPGGKCGQRRFGHARGLLAARRTFHSPDQRGGSHPGRALAACCWFSVGHDTTSIY